MEFNNILTYFKNPKPNGKDGFMVCCPCHDDKNQSLSICEKDGKILIHCFAGCKTQDILATVGLKPSDLFNRSNNSSSKPINVEYQYSDNLKKVRSYKNKDGNWVKYFYWLHRINGVWIKGTNGKAIPLYNQNVLNSKFTDDEVVYIVEGEKDVDTLTQLDLKAVCSPHGGSSGRLEGKWQDEYNDLFNGKNVVIIPDNDEVGKAFSDLIARKLIGYAKSIKVINLIDEWEDLPPKGDITDAFQLTKAGLGTDKKGIFLMKLYGITIGTNDFDPKSPEIKPPKPDNSKNNWEEPISFDDVDIPVFPVEAMPKNIQTYLKALAENIQVPIDIVCCNTLGILSLCIQKKYFIEIKPGWREQINLYILNIAAPSERKSPALSAQLKVLNEYEFNYNNCFKLEIARSKSEFLLLTKKREDLINNIAKNKSKDIEKDQQELALIDEEIALFKPKKELKLFHDNITPEKLGIVLADEDGCSAIVSSEGGIFDMLAGNMFKKNEDIDIFLKAFSGDDYRVDRVSRDSIIIRNPTLTMLLSVQPNVIENMMSNSKFLGRGLTARFLYSFPKTLVGTRPFFTKPIPESEIRKFETMIKDLLDNNTATENRERITISLSPEALTLFAEFYSFVETSLKSNYADINNWAGKIVGTTARIAAILLCADATVLYKDKSKYIVDADTMSRAITIGKYFIDHSLIVHTVLADAFTNLCKYVVERIKIKHLEIFTCRDLKRACKRIKKTEECFEVINNLIELGYIKELPEEQNKNVGRPTSPKYIANPSLFTKTDTKLDSKS